MGIHGLIEFGNRLLTFVLLIIALLTFITILRVHPGKDQLKRIIYAFFGFVALLVAGLALATREIDPLSIAVLSVSGLGILTMAGIFVAAAKRVERIGLVVPAFGLGFGIILQAVVGGITVLTQLNSWIVGLHFVISSALIALASLLVFRALPKPQSIKAGFSTALVWPVVIVSAITILIGVLVTGAGPHAGDGATERNGLDLEIWQHYHSYPGYLMLALVFLQWFAQVRHSKALFSNLATRTSTILLLTTVAQAVIGVVQARLGVPPFLVAAHMLGAAVLSSLVTFQFLLFRKSK
jgi:cytochrome c oxidase assembly protein subunit 15